MFCWISAIDRPFAKIFSQNLYHVQILKWLANKLAKIAPASIALPVINKCVSMSNKYINYSL